MGVGASSGRSSGGIKDKINKAHSADVGLKRFSRRKKHIDLIGRTARELVESAPEGEQLSQYKAQVAKFASEAYENDDDDEKNEKNENETQRNLVEELDEKDDTGKTMVTTPKTTTTVTKMGGTHTKFNISPLLPTELKLEASARAAKRATTTFAAAAAEEEKDPLRAQLEALRLEQKKKEELRVKATEDRVKAEEEAAKEAIVEKKKAKEVDVFDQLPTPEEDERIDNAYDSGELVNHACARLPGQGVMPLKGKDIHTLAPVTWLNDECVNFTLGILGRRERERCGPKGHPRCHFFNTFFLNKLFQDDGEYDYNKVRRWSTEKKLGYLPIKCEKVIVPVHQGVHWVLAVVDLKRKVVSYYDSLLGKDREVVRNLIKWVVDEAKNKLNENWDIGEWREEYPSEIPRQMNGSDCGMFMLNYARNIASFTDEDLKNNAFTFHQRDMVNLRRRLVLEILKIGLEMPADD
jgi:sentrin-specific protease 1